MDYISLCDSREYVQEPRLPCRLWTPSHSLGHFRLDMKFVLLHEAKNDEGIRAFFMDVWELYVKVGIILPIYCAISREVYLRVCRISVSAVYLPVRQR